MRQNESQAEQLRCYLLGELGEEECARIEEGLIGDGEFFEELQVVEDLLLDEYIQGRLSDRQREHLERCLTGTEEGRQRLLFASAMERYVELHAAEGATGEGEDSKRFHWFWKWLPSPLPVPAVVLAAAFLVVILAGTWAALQISSLGSQIELALNQRTLLQQREEALQKLLNSEGARKGELQTQVESLRTEVDRLKNEVDTLARGKGGETLRFVPTIAAFILSPGLLRDLGSSTRIALPARSPVVELLLDLGLDDYQTYRVTLQEATGEEILTQSKLRAQTREGRIVVVLSVPSSVLSLGDYSVRLSGVTRDGQIELIDRYAFRVVPD